MSNTPRTDAIMHQWNQGYDDRECIYSLRDLGLELEEENLRLRKKLKDAEKRISDYGWEQDARNGNVQGQW